MNEAVAHCQACDKPLDYYGRLCDACHEKFLGRADRSTAEYHHRVDHSLWEQVATAEEWERFGTVQRGRSL